MSGRKYKIAILPGDGIGPEVVSSAQAVLVAAAGKNSLELELVELQIGFEAYHKHGRTLPPETLSGMTECDGWILGPLSSGNYPKDDKDYPMASGKIRKGFDLYSNIRPVRSLLRQVGRPGIDLVIVRENTEDFYPDRNLFKGYGEFWTTPDTVISLRVVTRRACARISETAFSLARSRGKKRLVTAVNKANVLIEGDGLFLEEARKVGKKYPDVMLDEKLVDTTALQLVTMPESFDVILAANLYGDILSDEAAGLVGGLGLAPSLNAGEKHAMAQAVHGSAPDIAGKGVANPVAEILSTSMLLGWLNSRFLDDSRLASTAATIERAVISALNEFPKNLLPLDLGGSSSTDDFTGRILEKIGD
ncbi:MAG: isocitrate/isopropylmalate dehydrogenase family protein [Nitrososphaerales archaeon]